MSVYEISMKKGPTSEQTTRGCSPQPQRKRLKMASNSFTDDFAQEQVREVLWMINYLIDNQWKWNDCSLPIKRNTQRGARSQEEYLYQIVNCEEVSDPHEEKVKITMDKSFPFEPDTGFIWHKSWNLPEISLSLSYEEFEYLSSEYRTIRCEIMAVYPVKQGNYYFLNQVPLEGGCYKIITDPILSFKFLKFAETSFNHNRNKFCLLIWLFGENSYGDKDDIFCLISTPIYVDSRKEARKKQPQTPAVVNSLHTPKKFIAPVGGAKGMVANSSEGFLGYYSAQNIRNKIKHPFYICYHFDRVFRIFHNTEAEGVDLVVGLGYISSPNQRISQKIKNIFLIVILETDEKLRKKIISMMEKWRFNFIDYGHPDNTISPKWAQVTREDLKTAYRFFYENESIRDDDELIKKGMSEEGEKGDSPNNKMLAEKDRLQKQKARMSQNFLYRTVIDLSKPRKQVKREEI